MVESPSDREPRFHRIESRVSIGWRTESPSDGEPCFHWMESRVSIGWRAAFPLDGKPRFHWMEVYRSIVGVLAVVIDGRKRHFPGSFGMSPEFAMWQNRSDRFCHFSSTSLTLCFDQGKVLLLHAPRYMGLNGHVSLT